jgi:hypothetical protein
LAALANLSTRAAADSLKPRSLDDIKNAYTAVDRELENYQYSYTFRSEALWNELELTSKTNFVVIPEGKGLVFAAPDRMKLTYSERVPILKQNSADRPVYEEQSNSYSFDGVQLTHRPGGTLTSGGVARTTYRQLLPGEQSGPKFDAQPLDRVFVAFRIPGVPQDDKLRRRNRLLDLMETEKVAFDGYEAMDGVDCVRLSWKSGRVWLDPTIGLAVRKRQYLYNGRVAKEVRASEHKRFTANLYLPLKLELIFFGDEFSPVEFLERPVQKRTYFLSNLGVNRPTTDQTYQLEPARPGEWVRDETRSPTDKQGNPVAPGIPGNRGVAFIQPADAILIEAVAAEAAKRQGSPSGGFRRWGALHLAFVAFNIALIIGAAAVLIGRFRRRTISHH